MTNLFQIFCTTQRGYDPRKYPQPPIVSAEPSRGHEWPVSLSPKGVKIQQIIAAEELEEAGDGDTRGLAAAAARAGALAVVQLQNYGAEGRHLVLQCH